MGKSERSAWVGDVIEHNRSGCGSGRVLWVICYVMGRHGGMMLCEMWG